MNSDGYQIWVGIEQISDTHAILTDLGETLAFLETRGISTRHESLSDLIEKHLGIFEIKRKRDELSRVVGLPIQGLDIHLFAEALAGLTYLIFRHEPSAAIPASHVFQGVRRNLDRAKLKYLVGREASIIGITEKTIQVDFLVRAQRRIAIKTIQRRGRMHDYMEQWGYRWIDAKEADSEIIRAMYYDPDNQDWDDDSLAIGKHRCEIFRPYFESDRIHNDLQDLGIAA
jgi:hypothetical protein